MIFTQENEYPAVLDACVLVPMALSDLLLRLAEEPALYRPLWSAEILDEVESALHTKIGRSAEDASWRINQMTAAFPEALVNVPKELLYAVECIPDKKDRHVLAAAVMAHANAIVTQNTKHFPSECLTKFGVLCQNASDFLIHQFHLCPQVMLDKLDDQAAGIGRDRQFVLSSLNKIVPRFCAELNGAD
jgi:predicted nucleic acid-binding protein